MLSSPIVKKVYCLQMLMKKSAFFQNFSNFSPGLSFFLSFLLDFDEICAEFHETFQNILRKFWRRKCRFAEDCVTILRNVLTILEFNLMIFSILVFISSFQSYPKQRRRRTCPLCTRRRFGPSRRGHPRDGWLRNPGEIHLHERCHEAAPTCVPRSVEHTQRSTPWASGNKTCHCN